MKLGNFTKQFVIVVIALLVTAAASVFLFYAYRFVTKDSALQQVNKNFSNNNRNIVLSDTPDLIKAFKEYSDQTNEECPYFEKCFNGVFSENTKLEIARKYNVSETLSGSNDIQIGLLKGSSIDIGGIGTGYLKNKEYLNVNDNSWYWEIGACTTNKRIFVDALTGESGPLHTHVYCGGAF